MWFGIVRVSLNEIIFSKKIISLKTKVYLFMDCRIYKGKNNEETNTSSIQLQYFQAYKKIYTAYVWKLTSH